MGAEGSWGPGIIGLAAACEFLVLVFIALRVYTRIWIAKAFWWDDFTIVLAVLGTTIGCSLCFVEVHYGFGKHIEYLSPYELREFRKYTFGEWIQTFATLMWTKVSICLFLIRISKSRRLREGLYWCVGLLLFSNTVLTTMWIMGCQPVHVYWYGEGTCLSKRDKEAIIMTQAIISIISDFSLAAFPIFYFWRLQVDFKTKIGLWLLMCLGVITGACCLVRTVLNGQSIPVDETYDGIINWLWRLFEVQFGIIAACIPTLRPLWGLAVKLLRGDHSPLVDSNIKFLSSGKGSHDRWTEYKDSDPEKANGHASHGHTSNGNRLSHFLSSNKPAPAEDMRQDLLNQGIINSETASEPRNVSDTEKSDHLADEMGKYGIPLSVDSSYKANQQPQATNSSNYQDAAERSRHGQNSSLIAALDEGPPADAKESGGFLGGVTSHRSHKSGDSSQTRTDLHSSSAINQPQTSSMSRPSSPNGHPPTPSPPKKELWSPSSTAPSSRPQSSSPHSQAPFSPPPPQSQPQSPPSQAHHRGFPLTNVFHPPSSPSSSTTPQRLSPAASSTPRFLPPRQPINPAPASPPPLLLEPPNSNSLGRHSAREKMEQMLGIDSTRTPEGAFSVGAIDNDGTDTGMQGGEAEHQATAGTIASGHEVSAVASESRNQHGNGPGSGNGHTGGSSSLQAVLDAEANAAAASAASLGSGSSRSEHNRVGGGTFSSGNGSDGVAPSAAAVVVKGPMVAAKEWEPAL